MLELMESIHAVSARNRRMSEVKVSELRDVFTRRAMNSAKGRISACTRQYLLQVDSLYRRKHGLTVTGNYSMRDLVERERMHPAIVRRLDAMCGMI